MSTTRKRVAIVGGGIGGLALAVALSRLKVDEYLQIDIYESTAKLTQVGAGIMIWPRGWEIVQSMGLEASLAEKMSPDQELPSPDQIKPTFKIRRGDMKEDRPIVDVMMPGGSVAFHRADVQEVLLKHISPSIQVHLSHRLITYRETAQGEIELQFKNGSTASCDLLIGADGINSVIRKTFLRNKNKWSEEEASKKAQPLWTGSTVYRNTIDAEIIRKDSPNHRALTEAVMHLVAYPILQGKLINAVPFLTNYEREGTYVDGPVLVENSTDKFAPHFAGWDDDVEVLVKHMSNPSRWEIQHHAPLDTYISESGAVVLLGDSAHAAPPHLGNGASQAIEDVYILANVLSKGVRSGNFDIPKLIKIYDTIRQPFAVFAADASVRLGRLLDLHSPGFEDIKDGDEVTPESIEKLAKSIQDVWEWTWQSAKPDLEKALAMV
ncbi:hypothetical protein CVT25_010358 [Psilocybe cyanescens]|uniref:FAD-binding domain-containing protein n=1 Tax=Psilocybe cyanescens TaxID=93625 RepID=A0A409XNZ7_PSICY|nr:hypothetical protein CVT25_010358 [Psilocybe cyanescens]